MKGDDLLTTRDTIHFAVDERRYRCERGHEQSGEFRITAHDIGGKTEYQSGPLCRVCYVLSVSEGCETAPILEES